ncbi:MAG: alpha/beta fold hydrolase [Deltaproteobacteria bacterium]|nr:alpha/beta fold hydrolase [Deltaproteobacteria bacterium]
MACLRAPRRGFCSRKPILTSSSALLLVLVLSVGCRSTGQRRMHGAPPQEVEEKTEEIRFTLPQVAVGDRVDGEVIPNDVVGDSTEIVLGATWKGVPGASSPLLLLVPGAGRVSRRGVRTKNGSRAYDDPVPVIERLSSYAAYHGFQTLAYDKRTCGPNESPLCQRNKSPDWDKDGPIALVADVDAACNKAKEIAPDVPLVVVAHGQSANVVLASNCALRADVLVLIALIPDAVDRVLVRGLSRRAQLLRKWGEKKLRSKKASERAEGEKEVLESLQLQNRAANLRDIFSQIRAGRFSNDDDKNDNPQILGASASFWQGYFRLTEDAQKHAERTRATPRVIVLGQWDSQYAPADKDRIAHFGVVDGHRFVVVKEGDHHLLQNKELHDESFAEFLDVVRELLGEPSEKAPTS